LYLYFLETPTETEFGKIILSRKGLAIWREMEGSGSAVNK
jgi:hypothetical protein